LTKATFKNAHVLALLEYAFANDVTIFLVHDPKPKNEGAAFDFSEVNRVDESASTELKLRVFLLLREVESLEMQRRSYGLRALLFELVKRLRLEERYKIDLHKSKNLHKRKRGWFCFKKSIGGEDDRDRGRDDDGQVATARGGAPALPFDAARPASRRKSYEMPSRPESYEDDEVAVTQQVVDDDEAAPFEEGLAPSSFEHDQRV